MIHKNEDEERLAKIEELIVLANSAKEMFHESMSAIEIIMADRDEWKKRAEKFADAIRAHDRVLDSLATRDAEIARLREEMGKRDEQRRLLSNDYATLLDEHVALKRDSSTINVEAAVVVEREACADICDDEIRQWKVCGDKGECGAIRTCAQRIRARGSAPLKSEGDMSYR